MIKGAVLYAKNLELLSQFYARLGGYVVEKTDDEFAILKTSETELIILQAPEHIASQIVITNPPTAREATPVKLIIEVTSIVNALSLAKEWGGFKFGSSNQWEFSGNIVQDIVDPEGNIVQLWQQLKAAG